jgi:indole-3-glycerol phosphate synthase
MGTILDTILIHKQIEIETLKSKKVTDSIINLGKRSLIKALESNQNITVISEFKRKSPSKGIISDHIDPVSQALTYQLYGASAISVLTDNHFFNGSFSDLAKVKSNVNIPVLCKDFIIDHIQIDYANTYGADIILLIAKALSTERLIDLYNYARQLNLEVLVEIHDVNDLNKALETGTKLIGINNRDLRSFKVDLSVTEELAPLLQSKNVHIISESGINSREDVIRVRDRGASAILVGESLMKSRNIHQSFSDFIVPLVSKESI